MFNISDSISFQDVLLIPKHNSYSGEIATDISINRGEIEYCFSQPLIPSNSFLITDIKMAVSLIARNSLAVFHDGVEYYRGSYSDDAVKANLIRSIKEIKDICSSFLGRNDFQKYLGITIGVTPADYDLVYKLCELGIRIFCVENVVGDSDAVLAMVEFCRKLDPNCLIIAGDVVTGKAAKALWVTGADCVIVGLGASSKDNTREISGNGIPQLSALIDCASEKSRGQYIISKGGISTSGDIVKALCFSDFVMSYRIFEGCFEAPVRAGAVEVKTLLNSLLKDIELGCRLQNVSSIRQLQEDVSLVKLTSSGIIESRVT